MKTYYSEEQDGFWVRYWWDRYLKLWTANVVDHPSDAGHQRSASLYFARREEVITDTGWYNIEY
jgi:hypothetical protein